MRFGDDAVVDGAKHVPRNEVKGEEGWGFFWRNGGFPVINLDKFHQVWVLCQVVLQATQVVFDGLLVCAELC